MKFYVDQNCQLFNSYFSSSFEDINCCWVVWDQDEYTYDAEIEFYLKSMGSILLIINDKIYDDTKISKRIKEFKGAFGHRALLSINKKKNFSHKMFLDPYIYYIESCKYDSEIRSDVIKYLKLIRYGEANGLLINEEVDLRRFIKVLANAFWGSLVESRYFSTTAKNVLFSFPLIFHSFYKGSIIFGDLKIESQQGEIVKSRSEFDSVFGSYVWGINNLSILKEISKLLPESVT